MDARHTTATGTGLPAIPRDLAVASALAVLGATVVVVDPGVVFRTLLGVPLLLVLPGYAVLAAADPRRRTDGPTAEFDTLDRALLSVGLSLGLLAVLGFLVAATPWGITAPTVAVAAAVLTLAASTVAVRRRATVPLSERPPAWDPRTLLPRPGGGRLANGVAVVAVVVLVAAVGFGAYAPQGTEPYTAFSVQATSLDGVTFAPGPLPLGETSPVTVRVTNEEGTAVTYLVVVTRDRVTGGVEAPTAAVEVVETAAVGRYEFTLADAGTWTGDYGAAVPAEGRYRFTFDLYRVEAGAVGESPYRTLTLWSER